MTDRLLSLGADKYPVIDNVNFAYDGEALNAALDPDLIWRQQRDERG